MDSVLHEIAETTAEVYKKYPKEIWLLESTPKQKGKGIELQVQSNIKEACRSLPYFCELKYSGPDIIIYKDNQLIAKYEVKAGVDASRYWIYKEGLKQGVPCIFLSPSEIKDKVPEAIYYSINENWVIGVLEGV